MLPFLCTTQVKDAFVPSLVSPGLWVVPEWQPVVDPEAVNIRLEV